jgi:hypothetical protein
MTSPDSTKEFKAIKMNDLFQSSIVSNGACLPSFLASYISAALNASSSDLPAYLTGTSNTLEYPFSCVQLMIDTIKSMTNHTVTEYRESVNNTFIPEIKDLFG